MPSSRSCLSHIPHGMTCLGSFDPPHAAEHPFHMPAPYSPLWPTSSTTASITSTPNQQVATSMITTSRHPQLAFTVHALIDECQRTLFQQLWGARFPKIQLHQVYCKASTTSTPVFFAYNVGSIRDWVLMQAVDLQACYVFKLYINVDNPPRSIFLFSSPAAPQASRSIPTFHLQHLSLLTFI